MKWYSTQCSEISILSTFCALCRGCFIDYHIGQNGAQNEGLRLSNYCITGVALMEENESRIMEGWHAIPLVSQVQNSTSFYNRTQRQPNFCWTLPLKVIIKKQTYHKSLLVHKTLTFEHSSKALYLNNLMSKYEQEFHEMSKSSQFSDGWFS